MYRSVFMTCSLAVSISLGILLLPLQSLARVETGNIPPAFTLPSYDGNLVSVEDFKDNTVVLEWFAHDCEFTASHYDKGEGNMQKLQKEFSDQGVIWLTINSNSNALETDKMLEFADNWNMQSTEFLSDQSGEVGKAYGVTTTPQIFVIHKGELVYQGAADDRSSFFGLLLDRSTANSYIRQTLEEVLAGKPVSVPETKSYGCSIKYLQ